MGGKGVLCQGEDVGSDENDNKIKILKGRAV